MKRFETTEGLLEIDPVERKVAVEERLGGFDALSLLSKPLREN